MNRDLLEIFKNVNDWLKHAEAKNAMLVAFDGATIFGLIQIHDADLIKSSELLSYSLVGAIGFLTVSLIIALISFSPQLSFKPETGVAMQKEKNLLYFEYLRKIPTKNIAEEIVGKEISQIDQLDIDLAKQIRENARIASSKYSHFKVAVWITCAVFISALLISLIHISNIN